MHSREEHLCAIPAGLPKPSLQGGNHRLCQWRTSLLATFPERSNVRARAQDDSVAVEPDEFGKSQAGLGGEQQQRKIAPPDPSYPVGCREERFDLRARQKVNLPFVVSLAGYRKHAFNICAAGGLPESDEERADGGQTRVARTHTRRSMLLNIVEKQTDQRRIKIAKVEARRWLVQPRLHKLKQ